MATYKIEGGKPLNGVIIPVPNKNSILKLIPAALLTDDPVIIHNVPKSSDVRLMLKIVKQLGGKVSYLGDGSSVRIQANDLTTFEIDYDLSQKAKSSVMFMAPLLLRFKKAYMPIPGGCKLGTRPLDAFIDNMVQMGAEYRREKGYFLEANHLKAAKIWSWFPSVTGTENTVMLAVLTKGTTEIYNAACEPHTQDLCNILNAMGAKISGIGSNRLIIEGVDKLHGVDWNVIPDHLDIGAYIAAALLTNGEITIQNAIPEHMQLIIQFFQKLNAKIKIKGDEITVPANQKLECDLTVRGDIFDVKAFAWPFLPPDFVHVALVTALKAKGSFVFHNSFYEYGFFFIEELAKMKAKLIMADPYRIVTFGPTDYQAAKIIAPNIIQATMALFLAALSAPGVTILEDSEDSLLRRYPDLIANYQKLGAKITKL
jgi:UDP-N-acetylglucosamine 1-carboxyvinyltransferase